MDIQTIQYIAIFEINYNFIKPIYFDSYEILDF